MLSSLREIARFVMHNARWLGGGFLLTFYSSFGQTFFIGLFGNDIRATFNLSGGAFGGLYMIATISSAVTLLWLGRSLDVMPGWKVIRFTMPALALACLLMALAPNVIILGFALFLLRLFGQGMMTETAFTEIGRWFSANRGRAIALITPGQQLGSTLLPALVIFMTAATGNWRMPWFACAILVLIVGFPMIYLLMRVERTPQSDDIQRAQHRTARDWTRKEVIFDPVLYLLLAGTLAPAYIATVIFFQQGYLIELRGYSPSVFAIAFPITSIMTVFSGILCGFLVDRIGALKLLPFFLAPLAVAAAAVALVTPVWGVYVFMLLLGISNGFTSTLLGALWPEVYGVANLGGIRAIVVAAMVLSTAIGPGLSGLLIDMGIGLATQMLWMSGWCVLASIALTLASGIVRRREILR
ncbi:MFS transporter [uncultured Thioclava sp.]|jgi:MFS family permease|uniref:MFS transporter n=1 Tax=Thioclava arctica TaxID=3238301 RepID=A0ABV3TNZ0_9RHOB|nr:MFS transporter [uncultured Thioclava sp.]